MKRDRPPTRAYLPAVLASLLAGLCLAHQSTSAHGPTDWSEWQRYRQSVVHPAGPIKKVDIERARRNVATHAWARTWVEGQRRSADRFLAKLTPEYLATMIEVTSPGCAGACPACIAKKLAWHPTGSWSWSAERPQQLTCKLCKTVYPNPDYPEDIAIRSSYDPRQVFTYCGGTLYKCHGYKQARPSPSSIVRAKKLGYVTGQLQTLGRVYAVTQDAKYAHGARAILLRLADVFPKYLVCANYGYLEYADCDPHLACEHVADLPTDEICPPPNKPDRKLWTGYWSASRNGSWGHEGGWGMRVAEAYDLTCNARDAKVAVFSEEEKLRIERDVLLESTYLCVCEPRLTNKSIRGRCSAAMIGSIVGHPGLVHWGVGQFCEAVDGGWFLPDGGTSESSSYAITVMTAVDSFMTVFRNYTDPDGYSPTQGERLVGWNGCRDTRFGDCWQALLWTLQGDLTFPPLADTFPDAKIPMRLVELLAACYPAPEHRGFLQERQGGKLQGNGWHSLFYRDAQLDTEDLPRTALPDVVFPQLAQGYLRSGPGGRSGATVLNASAWGSHHHHDSLNLYLWQEGHELLSDLGYLWDNPNKKYLSRTFAHHLVMIDGREQRSGGRGGSFHLFATSPAVKVMEASSKAYANATQYRRTCAQIACGNEGTYLLDIFRVAGGKTRDHVFHGPNMDMTLKGLDAQPHDASAESFNASLATLTNVRKASGTQPWRAIWKLGDEYHFQALSPGAENEAVLLGDGWGQRNAHNKDLGVTLPYLVRRTAGPAPTAYLSVFEGYTSNGPCVRAVRRLRLPESAAADSIAVAIETSVGTDVIVSQLQAQSLTLDTPAGAIRTDGLLAFAREHASNVIERFRYGGRTLKVRGISLDDEKATLSGAHATAHSNSGDSWFVLDTHVLASDALPGNTLFITDTNGTRRAWPIRHTASDARSTRIYTKKDHVGFQATGKGAWEILSVAYQRAPDGT